MIKRKYYSNIKPDNAGIFSIPNIEGYIPIFSYIIFPQYSAQTFVIIQYDPENHTFYGKSSLGNQGIEINVIYNKIWGFMVMTITFIVTCQIYYWYI